MPIQVQETLLLFDCGITVPAHDHVGLARSILEFYLMRNKFAQFSLNARNAVNKFMTMMLWR